MCGILGLVELGDAGGHAALARAGEVLAHRGPDGAAIWSTRVGAAHVTLGHRRLSIIDLSCAGAQPMLELVDGTIRPARTPNEDARLAMVYNGEIYNYLELRQELRKTGRRFTSESDSEVLLAAYAEWGEHCLERLNGMFAFAIWDHENRRLFCARDRFGEKPFYHTNDSRNGRFAFASEVKALAAMGAISCRLDARAVYRYFRFGEQGGVPETMWSDVRKLLPATTLTAHVTESACRTETRRYWNVSLTDDSSMSLHDAAAGFADVFRDSVRLRLRADVPVGTSLSGGLDSSSVLCQIHALGAAGGQTAFTSRTDDPALDEGPHVASVLARTGVPGYSVLPTAAEFLEELDRLAFHQEEPFASTSVFASFLVQRLAREHGVTVMLDGQGADEYLAGYAHYPALVLASLAKEGQWNAWRRERAAVQKLIGVDPVPLRAAIKYRLSSIRNGRAAPLAIDTVRNVAHLSADLRAEFAGEEARVLVKEGDALKVRLYADLMQGHLQELLRYADRNSMAFSRELRLPFLDHRLVELSLSLPSWMLFGGGRSKRVLREAMRGIVPDAILERGDKVGFVAPWARWWEEDRFTAEMRSRIVEGAEELAGLVDPAAVQPGSPAVLGLVTLASSQRQLRALTSPAVGAL